MTRTANKFQRGSGCFNCHSCGRSTRDTGGDNTAVRLCAECYEIGGIENQIADQSFYGEQTEASCLAEIEKLRTAIVAKGGKLEN